MHTDWGCFWPRHPLPDGPVWLTIRPEQVRLSQNGGGNSLPARVVSQTYLGTHTKLKLNAAAIPLEMRSPDSDATHFCPGDMVNLYLPPDKTWLLPVDG
ncbi:MAG: TOBE domain-containing protein [Chloroflexi bacterium]|nr:TOBE domain-containing protein [Chloroflexota bacterium]